jgi:hypothetical protein
MTANFSDYQLLPIFFISVGVIFVSTEIGRWLGTRAGDGGGEQVRTLEAAVLGLLALIIAFTFAMALSRYEARRDAVLSEANAVGTTALRARLLPEPHNAETLRLLRDYVKVRLDAAQRAFGAAEFDAAIARSGQIQEALWQQAMAVAAKNQDLVPTGLFIDALNKMIDEHEKRLTAFRNHVPNVVCDPRGCRYTQ